MLKIDSSLVDFPDYIEKYTDLYNKIIYSDKTKEFLIRTEEIKEFEPNTWYFYSYQEYRNICYCDGNYAMWFFGLTQKKGNNANTNIFNVYKMEKTIEKKGLVYQTAFIDNRHYFKIIES